MFCKHNWQLIHEFKTKSICDELLSRGWKFNISDVDFVKGKYIQTFTCDKCGKLKRYVEVV